MSHANIDRSMSHTNIDTYNSANIFRREFSEIENIRNQGTGTGHLANRLVR